MSLSNPAISCWHEFLFLFAQRNISPTDFCCHVGYNLDLTLFYHHCDVTCICVVRGGKRACLLHPSPPLPAPLHNLPYGVFTLTAALSPWLRRPARQLQSEIRTWFIFPSKHFSAERQPMNQSEGNGDGQIERHRGHCLPADHWV